MNSFGLACARCVLHHSHPRARAGPKLTRDPRLLPLTPPPCARRAQDDPRGDARRQDSAKLPRQLRAPAGSAQRVSARPPRDAHAMDRDFTPWRQGHGHHRMRAVTTARSLLPLPPLTGAATKPGSAHGCASTSVRRTSIASTRSSSGDSGCGKRRRKRGWCERLRAVKQHETAREARLTERAARGGLTRGRREPEAA